MVLEFLEFLVNVINCILLILLAIEVTEIITGAVARGWYTAKSKFSFHRQETIEIRK